MADERPKTALLDPVDLNGIHAVTPRIYGGGFGKSDRFRSSGPVASPGPVYLVPSLMDTQHVQTNIYRQDAAPALSRAATATSSTGSPPRVSARTRSAWLMGSTIDDIAHYKAEANMHGPATYLPSIDQVRPAAPRTAIDHAKRFGPGVSPGTESRNLCLHSPGPKYLPQLSTAELKGATPPAYSFRSANSLADRSKFIAGHIKQGYYYSAECATRNSFSQGSGQAEKGEALTQTTAPRPVWGKADRFRTQNKIFNSRRLAKIENYGVHSPGPAYRPMNYEIQPPQRVAVAAPGKWIP